MKTRNVTSVMVAALLFISLQALAQKKADSNKMQWFKTSSHTVCYAAEGDTHVFIPPPGMNAKGSRIQAVDTIGKIKVTYDGFSDQAKKAFQYAVNIWRTLIVTEDTIHIHAKWETLGTNVLGSASPASFYANFAGAQRDGVYYPVALAEKIAHKQLNAATDADIAASFNSANSSWYYGTDGLTPAGKYDLVSVVLHEIGHGLGVFGFYDVSSGSASLSFGIPSPFDTYMQTATPKNIVSGYTLPSTTLATVFTGGALYYSSPLILANNASTPAKLYAPTTFSAGSSIYHLDENTYTNGNINSLMTPQFNSAEAIHNPGPIVRSMLKDMGWNDLYVQHTKLPSTETVSNDFTVIGKLFNDTTFSASTLKLSYSTGSTTFTSVTMTPTANANEYSAIIPKPTAAAGTVTSYAYYMSVTDNAQRTFTFPGQLWQAGVATQQQYYFTFTAGPDTQAPIISHTPTGFIKSSVTTLKLEALITDNIGVQSAAIQYSINGTAQPDVPMVLKSTIDPSVTDSTFTATLSLPTLVDGDIIKYRITATDVSAAHNTSYKPTSDYYTVNVVSLAATQNSYSNNFNTASSDFFGDNLFGISKATGFSSSAINTTHPYPISDPKDSISYIYELKIPIKISATNPIIKFDEVVLVEPNDTGSTFGGTGFYDYVVTEGSTDGGVTWKPFLTGYNCRAQSVWLTRWNLSNDGSKYPNSTGTGDSTLLKTRTINMLTNGKFKAGDVVVIRFRLLSDQLTAGWGWIIDNLKIQVDDVAPTILHNQVDFLSSSANTLGLSAKVSDVSGVKSLAFELGVNNGTTSSSAITTVAGAATYNLSVQLSGLKAGDEIEYRIVATDSVGNTGTLPSSGYFKVAMLDFSTPLTTYVTDFNSANTDFAGNFYSITTPTGFTDGAIHSSHPYPVGFGLDNTSSFQYMLKKPITVSATNPRIYFNEIAVTEFVGVNTKDYVIVEGSKDGGATWSKLLNAYSANAYTDWQAAFTNSTTPTSTLYKSRVIDITSTGSFKAGDNVLIRFRLYSDALTNSWGWAIDNLSIQGPVTGIEKTSVEEVGLYPNPVNTGYLSIEVPTAIQGGALSLISVQGQEMFSSPRELTAGTNKLFVGDFAEGLYLVRIQSQEGSITRKIIIKK